MKILYVEDTLLNLCLVERIAHMGHHEVINYAFAEHALRNFEQDKPDLALVDIRLEGEMSGVELIQRLRSAGHQQPIVVITAIATEDMRERCLLVGANDYFIKPVAVRDLLHIIQRHEKTLSEPPEESSMESSPPELSIAVQTEEPPKQMASYRRSTETQPDAKEQPQPFTATTQAVL